MNKDNQSNTDELDFVRKFVTDKMDSLQKDVKHCLQRPFAPMPAILWCVSCVDLLGALQAGQASDKADTSRNSRKYMKLFMGYTPEQIDLILKVFRHKLVHLAQPGPLSSYKGKTVAWQYVHEYTPDHLALQDCPDQVTVRPGWIVHVDQVFTLGITQFMQDIRNSVFRTGGYLQKLETNTDILKRCKDAIQEIYTPQLIKDRSVTNSRVTKS
ncbi:MAG: hypothetical protein GEU26_08910 [Nitrososphaeraceae archaeon]|nr:hypothetical protein [Nitrososphaeraceae archaeon]